MSILFGPTPNAAVFNRNFTVKCASPPTSVGPTPPPTTTNPSYTYTPTPLHSHSPSSLSLHRSQTSFSDSSSVRYVSEILWLPHVSLI
ncbi:hypothetical protein YC2023_119509 [Brassica napus]